MNENKTNINCDKTIYINIDSNHWKYGFFYNVNKYINKWS